MKLVKIFGAVMAVHAAVFMFVFAIPGCRSTSKKTPATAPVIGAENTPVDAGSPIAESAIAPAEVAPVRFSPTRPGTAAAASVEAAPAAVAVAAAPSSYTVVKGDNLWTIAKKNNVTVKQLTAANNMRADSTLKLGQKLTIPGKTAAAAPAGVAPAAATTVTPTAAKAASTTAVTHVIKTGETLGSIAKKYSVKVGDIAAANNIADPTKIRVGQTLKIPGWQSPAKAGSKSAAAPAAHTKPSATAKSAPATPAPAPEAAPVQPAAPASPLFSSPLADPAPASSPFVSPAPDNSGAPVQHVEDSGAPKIE